MIAAFSIIGFLILILIYFAVRHQNTQRELIQLRRMVKSLDSQGKFSLSALMMLSSQLQKTYQARLESLKKHALVSEVDYSAASFVVTQVEFVISQCCEQRATVEEAINKALESSNLNIELVNQFIARQPSEVRIPWCKNTIGGFISACHNMTSESVKLSARKPDLRQEKD